MKANQEKQRKLLGKFSKENDGVDFTTKSIEEILQKIYEIEAIRNIEIELDFGGFQITRDLTKLRKYFQNVLMFKSGELKKEIKELKNINNTLEIQSNKVLNNNSSLLKEIAQLEEDKEACGKAFNLAGKEIAKLKQKLKQGWNLKQFFTEKLGLDKLEVEKFIENDHYNGELIPLSNGQTIIEITAYYKEK